MAGIETRLLDVLFKKQDRILNVLADLTAQLAFVSKQNSQNSLLIAEIAKQTQDEFKKLDVIVDEQFPTFFKSVEQIRKDVEEIHDMMFPDPASVIEFYTLINNQLTKVEKMDLRDNQKLPLTIAIKDAKGNAALVDGVPAWSSSDESLATLVVADDGMSAEVTAVGPLGDLQINVSADADLGEGVVPIQNSFPITIVGAQAQSIEFAAGKPVDQ